MPDSLARNAVLPPPAAHCPSALEALDASDLWFHFESLGACWRPFKGKSYDVARQIANYVAAFVKTGDPNCCDVDGVPQAEWRPYTKCKGPMHYTDECRQEEDSFVSPVMNFLVDYYLGTYR